MPDIKLPIIIMPKEGTRTVISLGIGSSMRGKGEGDVNYLCGNCGRVLVNGAREDQIRNIVFHCPCGSYNDLKWGKNETRNKT